MFAVNGHDMRARYCAQWLHHWAGRNEALLVGKRQPLAAREGCKSYGKAGKTNNTVHDNIGVMYDVGEIGGNMDTGQQGGHRAASRFVSYYNYTWLPSFSLLDDHIDGRSNAECDHFKLVGRRSNDVQRLDAN